MRPTIRIAVVAAAAIVTFLVMSSGQAFASHVSCGDTITQDTKLDSDLVNCPGDGIVIGADNITLDLDGHTIDGIPGQGTSGVNNTAGHAGITVEKGRIQDFLIGVRLEGANENLVTKLTFHVSSAAFLIDSDRNEISKNSLLESVITVADRSDHNLIEKNEVTNGHVQITPFSDVVSLPTGNRVEKNTVHGGEYAIFIALANDTLVERNRFFDNSDEAVLITAGCGGTHLLDNSIAGNGLGVFLSGCRDTLIARNRIEANTGDGIVATNLSAITVIERNVASGNGDDGIDVRSPRTTLTANIANNNFDFGIEAVAGVTDGGGNKASGNGNSAQCQNVVCK